MDSQEWFSHLLNLLVEEQGNSSSVEPFEAIT